MDRVTVKQALNGFRFAGETKRARFYSNSYLPKALAKGSEASGAVYQVVKHRHWCLRQLTLLALLLLQLLFVSGIGAQVQVPAGRGVVRLEATQQRKEGDRYIADGDVDVRYLDMRLRADHIEYDSKTYETLARGHVIFDYNTQHIEGNEGHYNVRSDRGVFLQVHGTITVARRPNPNVLFSTNPIYFEADEVDRLSDQTYLFKKTWLTICLPNRPFWKFYAVHATLKVNQKVVLVRANFRLLKVPLIYLPYASIPASQ